MPIIEGLFVIPRPHLPIKHRSVAHLVSGIRHAQGNSRFKETQFTIARGELQDRTKEQIEFNVILINAFFSDILGIISEPRTKKISKIAGEAK